MNYKLFNLLFLLSACTYRSDSLSYISDSLSYIKEKYTQEELNFFYEVAFNSEITSLREHPIIKWEQDLLLYIKGDTLVGDRTNVLEAIKQLNTLTLPIHLFLVENESQSNVNILFGSRKDLSLSENVHGRFDLTVDQKGIIQEASVRILTELGSEMVGKRRKSVILEEITQTLGLIGDSYSDSQSIFYENWNAQDRITSLDKRMIELLYESTIYPGYTCAQFEDDFNDVLQSVGSKKGFFQSELYYRSIEQKFLNYVRNQPVKQFTIKQILHKGLVKSQLDTILKVVKYIKPVPVFLHGDTTNEHKIIVQKIISLFEHTTPYLHLYLSNQAPSAKLGIRVNFEKNKSLSRVVTAQTYPWYAEDSLFLQRIGAEIEVVYKDTSNVLPKLSKALADIFYHSVCTVQGTNIKPSIYQNKDLKFKPRYVDVLRTYYAPELTNNMTEDQLKNVLSQVE